MGGRKTLQRIDLPEFPRVYAVREFAQPIGAMVRWPGNDRLGGGKRTQDHPAFTVRVQSPRKHPCRLFLGAPGSSDPAALESVYVFASV